MPFRKGSGVLLARAHVDPATPRRTCRCRGISHRMVSWLKIGRATRASHQQAIPANTCVSPTSAGWFKPPAKFPPTLNRSSGRHVAPNSLTWRRLGFALHGSDPLEPGDPSSDLAIRHWGATGARTTTISLATPFVNESPDWRGLALSPCPPTIIRRRFAGPFTPAAYERVNQSFLISARSSSELEKLRVLPIRRRPSFIRVGWKAKQAPAIQVWLVITGISSRLKRLPPTTSNARCMTNAASMASMSDVAPIIQLAVRCGSSPA
jgi:hypothetical protein